MQNILYQRGDSGSGHLEVFVIILWLRKDGVEKKKMSGVKSNNRAIRIETINVYIYSLMLPHWVLARTISQEVVWGCSEASKKSGAQFSEFRR